MTRDDVLWGALHLFLAVACVAAVVIAFAMAAVLLAAIYVAVTP